MDFFQSKAKKNCDSVLESKRFETKYHACSIEFIPTDGGKVFACGTYEYDEGAAYRFGEVLLYNLDQDVPPAIIDCGSGILDMKFANQHLVTALAAESLNVFKIASLTGEETNHSIGKTTKEGEGLFLSVDIDNRLSSQSFETSTQVGISTQNGSALVFEYNQNQIVEKNHIPKAHMMAGEAMPVWIVAFDPHSKNTIITGGDDSKFKLWDVRSCGSGYARPVSVNKYHDAGVTSAQWHPIDQNLFVTGSYDESVMLWDQRKLTIPVAQVNTGGGVWRCKWVLVNDEGISYSYEKNKKNSSENNFYSQYLITANMQEGCQVYQVDKDISSLSTNLEEDNGEVLKLAAAFKDTNNLEHLAYGIDVLSCEITDFNDVDEMESSVRSECIVPTEHVEKIDSSTGLSGKSHEFTLASCSFYDNAVSVWKTKVPLN